MAYINRELALKLLERNGITKQITFSDGVSIYDTIANIPTADVVPKSELSIIGVQNMALENTNVDLKRRLVIAEAVASAAVGKASEMIAEAKREVAREIFAEIESVLFHTLIVPTVTKFGIIENKKIDGLHIRIEDYNKIKKQYTEDPTNG